ncbi:MAG: hypothetical protein ACRDRU_21130 [Pseudonocardiaceae bacterium]
MSPLGQLPDNRVVAHPHRGGLVSDVKVPDRLVVAAPLSWARSK